MSAIASFDQDLSGAERRFLLGVGGGFSFRRPRPLPLLPGVDVLPNSAPRAGSPSCGTPLGELHDVPLVHQRDALPLVADRVGDRGADEALAPLLRDRLQAEGDGLREADLLERRGELPLEEVEDLLHVGEPSANSMPA